MELKALQDIISKYVVSNTGRVSRYSKKEDWWEDRDIHDAYIELHNKFSHYNFNDEYVQWIYNIVNDISSPPICEVCGVNPRQFYTFTTGYRNCCSALCAKNHPNFNEKRRKTCLQKYGVEHPTQLQEEQDKRIISSIKKYGVNHPSQTQEMQDKIKKTCLIKYGYAHPSSSPEIKRKKVETCFLNYGVTNPSKSEQIREKRKQTTKQKYGAEHYSQSDEYMDTQCLDLPILKCKEWLENEFSTKSTTQIATELGTKAPRILYWINKHGIEYVYHSLTYPQKQLNEFLTSLNISFIIEDRKEIYPQEIDVLVKDRNIGIEMNGVFWHSDHKKHKTYHVEKLERCVDKNIKLLQFWDIEWHNYPEICRSIIKTNLGLNKVIHARKCQIKNLNYNTTKTFLQDNHIQGNCRSSVKLGLFYNDELISVMTFGKPRFNKNYEWELIRFCNKIGYNVIGGASKLLRYFEKTFIPANLLSYSDRRLFDGKLYEKLGFTCLYNTEPNYFYTKQGVILTRYQAQKHKLKDILSDFDADKSEMENMKNNKWYVVYDCGNSVWEINYGEI